MNVQLSETVEHIDGKPTGTLGMVLIRCVLTATCVFPFSVRGGAQRRRLDEMQRKLTFALLAREHRCNNVLWMSADAGVKAENGDTEMKG